MIQSIQEDGREKRTSRIMELREMLPSFQTAVVCTILESISGLELSPATTEAR